MLLGGRDLIGRFRYTEQTGLPYFDRATSTAIRNWYYASALESMRGHHSFFAAVW